MIDKEQFKKDLRKIIDQGNQFVADAIAHYEKYKPYLKELESLKDGDLELNNLLKEAEELSDKFDEV